jgi:hypothetical protein
LAKTKLPDPLARRHLLERELPPAQALKLAEAYLAEGRVLEAADFLRKANAGEKLAALRADAVAGGDAFLLRAVAAAQAQEPTAAEWRALADAAAAAGRERYAADARRQAARGEE